MKQCTAWLSGFKPAPMHVGFNEKLHASLGAWIGLLLTAVISKATLGSVNPWLVAPMGASAVLLFALPASPLAQPWSLIGGNLVSGLIGVTCARWIDDTTLAASLAGALAIAAMFRLRCLHPPSGAVALTAVLGGAQIREAGYAFVLWPVGLNSLVLLIAALLFHNLFFNKSAKRCYPHGAVPKPHLTKDEAPNERLGFTRADLVQALKLHHEIVDISAEDLENIFAKTEMLAYARRKGSILCAQVMAKDVVTIEFSASADAAWELLMRHKIHALPVVDGWGELAGIVTLHDLVAQGALAHVTGDSNATPRLQSSQNVNQLMNRDVKTVRPEQDILSLVADNVAEQHHHWPVVDQHNKVVGMLTHSDVIAALYQLLLQERGSAISASSTAQPQR